MAKYDHNFGRNKPCKNSFCTMDFVGHRCRNRQQLKLLTKIGKKSEIQHSKSFSFRNYLSNSMGMVYWLTLNHMMFGKRGPSLSQSGKELNSTEML